MSEKAGKNETLWHVTIEGEGPTRLSAIKEFERQLVQLRNEWHRECRSAGHGRDPETGDPIGYFRAVTGPRQQPLTQEELVRLRQLLSAQTE